MKMEPCRGRDARSGLLARWQEQGEHDALEELLEEEILALKNRVRREAHGLVRNFDSASDVAQEVACRFLRAENDRWFETPAALRSYLWTAALNLLYARKKQERSAPAAAAVPERSEPLDPGATEGAVQLIEKERSVALRFAIELIGEREREILELVYFQGFGLETAAERLGIRPDNARARLVRARKSLAQKLCRWRDLIEA